MEASSRLHGLPQRLAEDEEIRLRTLLPSLQELCSRLLDYGVPDALDHGDLHSGNVFLAQDGFRIFDWSHACLICPFYGFGSLLLDDDWFTEQPEARMKLRDTYLDPWTLFLPQAQLVAAFELWKRIRSLFQVAHQSHIVGSYLKMLGGHDYVAETATGNSMQHMQWWLAAGLRQLLSGQSGDGH